MLAGEGWLGLWGGPVEGGCGERVGTVSLSRRQGDCSEKREAGGGSRRDGTDRLGEAPGETEGARPRWGD